MKNRNLKLHFKIPIVLLLLLISLSNSYSQYKVKTFNINCTNGTSRTDISRAIINRIDKGYAITGYSSTPYSTCGSTDWMFSKLDSNGKMVATRLIGFANSDFCNSLKQTSDSSYFLAGHMNYVTDGKDKATFVKLNKNGDFFISKRISNGQLSSEYNHVAIAPKDTLAFIGESDYLYQNPNETRSKILITLYNSNGSMIWGNNYVIPGNTRSSDHGSSICYQNKDKTFGVASYTNYTSTSRRELILMKISRSTGAIVWQNIYRFTNPSTSSPETYPSRIIPLKDGGFVVTGWSNVNSSPYDIFVMKVASDGSIMWSKTYGNTDILECGTSITLDSPYLLVAGYSMTPSTQNSLIMKISLGEGALIWNKSWNTNGEINYAFDIVNNAGSISGYTMTGVYKNAFSTYDILFWKVNNDGMIPGASCNYSQSLTVTNNDYIIDPIHMSWIPVQDAAWFPKSFISKHDSTLKCSSSSASGKGTIIEGDIQEFTLYQNYPNPFNPVTNIQFTIPIEGNVKLTVYDMVGKEIATLVNQTLMSGSHTIKFDGSAFSSGVYFYRLESNTFSEVRRMILVK